MSTIEQVGMMYDALLSIKALKDPVKLDIRIPCHLTLVLMLAVEQAISGSDPGNLFRKIVSEDDQTRLFDLAREILKKGELEDFYDKLKGMEAGIKGSSK
jgi:hypothetical protein